MKTVEELLYASGLVPVVKINDPSKAVDVAKAIYQGGLTAIEITFRTDCALESIASIAKELPDLYMGAGTVLTTKQVDQAVAAGAKFIVAPGFNPTVVSHCISIGVPVIPGCSTASEMEQAMEMGLKIVKFFPAESAGGVSMLKALSAPYTKLKFMPTGGINLDNMMSYLNFDPVVACGGSFMVKEDLIDQNKFDEIEKISRQAVEKMIGFELRHIGLNLPDDETSLNTAKRLCALFGLPLKEGRSSNFAGKEFELMKKPGRGTNGHIALACNSLERAEAYLANKGMTFVDETRAYNAKGQESVVYLAEEIGGFAIHLVRK